MEQEPLRHDPQREVVAAPTEIYSEALQQENNKAPVYQSSLRPFFLLLLV